jgi:hypothetical protein
VPRRGELPRGAAMGGKDSECVREDGAWAGEGIGGRRLTW